MRILYFKGKKAEVFAEWAQMVKHIGHCTLKELKPKER